MVLYVPLFGLNHDIGIIEIHGILTEGLSDSNKAERSTVSLKSMIEAKDFRCGSVCHNICIFVCVHICVCGCGCRCMFMSMYASVCMYVSMLVCMYVCKCMQKAL